MLGVLPYTIMVSTAQEYVTVIDNAWCATVKHNGVYWSMVVPVVLLYTVIISTGHSSTKILD